ncbi:FG-GAP repeat domain-containing protein [Plesiocystis pacifica]|uniref:FG-GAP repeat domain-containing protein n=1 Tax=Plesiocystis pacifica TaxID=191768 RepID=UPI0012FCB22E|nr:VCBS repeat-containing protein [Plesiocystis pacifica]
MRTSAAPSTRPLSLVALGVTLACAPDPGLEDGPATVGDESGTDEASAGTEAGSTGSDDGTGGEPEPLPCALESDCGLGQVCVDGACACVGCGCEDQGARSGQGPRAASAEGFARGARPTPPPLTLDLPEPDCEESDECLPGLACVGGDCVETSPCVDDQDCRADWSDRFCDAELGVCEPRACDYLEFEDQECAPGALCAVGRCQWLAQPPACAQALALAPAPIQDLSAGAEQLQFMVFDLDGDGDEELLRLADGGIDSFELADPRAPELGFGSPTPLSLEPGEVPTRLARGDLEGDGVDELLLTTARPMGVSIYATGPAPARVASVELPSSPTSAALVDIDRDGLVDLLTRGGSEGAASWDWWLHHGASEYELVWTTDYAAEYELGRLLPEAYAPAYCQSATASEAPGGGSWETIHILDFEGVDRELLVSLRPRADLELFRGVVGGGSVEGHSWTGSAGPHGALVLGRPMGGRRYVELATDPQATILGLFDEIGGGDLERRHAITSHADSSTASVIAVDVIDGQFEPTCVSDLELGPGIVELSLGDFDGDGRDELLAELASGEHQLWFGAP